MGTSSARALTPACEAREPRRPTNRSRAIAIRQLLTSGYSARSPNSGVPLCTPLTVTDTATPPSQPAGLSEPPNHKAQFFKLQVAAAAQAPSMARHEFMNELNIIH